MSYFSIWPAAICMFSFYVFASIPLLHADDIPPGNVSRRNSTLDGLRGFLALAVVIHHGAIYHNYLAMGVWEQPPSNLYNGLGQAGVSAFFMVTGYLFWRKVLSETAGGGVNWGALVFGRIFRIAPVYLLTVLIQVTVIACLTGWTLTEPAFTVSKQIAELFSFGILSTADIKLNGYQDTTYLIAGVTWSLQYEWGFYFALPLLALCLKLRLLAPRLGQAVSWMLPLAITALALFKKGAMSDPIPLACVALFGMGMFTAACKPLRVGSNWIRSIIVLILIGSALTLFSTTYKTGPMLMIGAAFMFIVSGCNIFGLLTSRPARRLGDISYGIYLLQGLTLAAVYWPSPLSALALSGPVAHWALFLLSGIALICGATAAHVYVELPGQAVGRWIIALLRTRTAT